MRPSKDLRAWPKEAVVRLPITAIWSPISECAMSTSSSVRDGMGPMMVRCNALALRVNTSKSQRQLVLGIAVHSICPLENCKVLNILGLCHRYPEAMQL
ncbi:hypothetical protein N7519_000992 [Penicillium mononematosum]|uniref:uncharacterized protein n=1 Tax=Penicillium mononematosum TaxID=268346 RepID=UPI002549336D|nr:uncharacterized protein N7519_000992 [Penicillium mononematosum]KAJ6190971.1 hypothetical protein N7519_000992 [Penicillium mononematosum]